MGVIELAPRDAINDIKSAPQTFSSWNSCMTKAYCKWPAIAGIVIGSIIILSILFCCFRCLCCGLECCCGCFSCFNHCCPSPRGKKRSKYADGPSYQPSPYNGGYHGYQPAPAAPPTYEAPKYAQFEAPSKKVHEDTLPAMPSWDAAATRKVEDNTHDDMEMNSFNKEAGSGVGAAAVAAGRQANQTGHSPNPYGNTSPTTPYGAAGIRGSNYSRPSIPTNNSDGSQQSSVYGAQRNQQSSPYGTQQNQSSYGQQTHQSSQYGSQQNAPTSQTRPFGGYRNPASADQFQSSAIAPTPQQYGAAQATNAYPSYSGAPRYEPQNQYGQETGVTQASPTSPRSERPPSILQAGRKPVAGTWRDV